MPDHDVDDRLAVYRVRVWTDPQRPLHAWAIDDWEITEAESVAEVIEWARVHNDELHSTEILVRTSPTESWIRLFGKPADDSEKVITVPLVRDA